MPTSNNGFILTSNRDESPQRATISPTYYTENEVRLLYPKDALAGGTWIGASDRNRLVCLLNGGFEAHEREPSYRISRGVIVKKLLVEKDLITAVNTLDFRGVEPFTIISVEWSKDARLYELVWDGSHVHFSEKPFAPSIWSSSLLYSSGVKAQREKWFSNFLFETMEPTSDDLLDFHKTAGQGDLATNLIMDRGFVKTKSISQFSFLEDRASFRYEDLDDQLISTLTL